jgi:8-oxo-dGTP diphosphatase
MIEFRDANGHKVEFLEEPNSFSEKVDHVLVICKYKNQWLLTNHKKRGWEFPGGKIETGESIEEAAIREVWEETGASLQKLIAIGSYKVTDSSGYFVKKVFLGPIESVYNKEHYLETNGPLLVEEEILLKERFQPHYSFIMQDLLIDLCIERIKKIESAIF